MTDGVVADAAGDAVGSVVAVDGAEEVASEAGSSDGVATVVESDVAGDDIFGAGVFELGIVLGFAAAAEDAAGLAVHSFDLIYIF